MRVLRFDSALMGCVSEHMGCVEALARTGQSISSVEVMNRHTGGWFISLSDWRDTASLTRSEMRRGFRCAPVIAWTVHPGCDQRGGNVQADVGEVVCWVFCREREVQVVCGVKRHHSVVAVGKWDVDVVGTLWLWRC